MTTQLRQATKREIVRPMEQGASAKLARMHSALPPSDGTQLKKEFGESALRIHHKIFAMLVKGKLVVKLHKARVDALITAGEGERFDHGHSRLMKKWLAVEPTSKEGWLDLAREAMGFVASQP